MKQSLGIIATLIFLWLACMFLIIYTPAINKNIQLLTNNTVELIEEVETAVAETEAETAVAETEAETVETQIEETKVMKEEKKSFPNLIEYITGVYEE